MEDALICLVTQASTALSSPGRLYKHRSEERGTVNPRTGVQQHGKGTLYCCLGRAR